ncbi:MAG: helix-turn-helix domain-containing protein, partial [Oscillospiraceae bacterium]|nr:helix-turn-helix domain-containing protein [Oscillospiraceae bacterium]
MTVGQRIAQKRKELGISQEGLGERLGVSRQTVYKWESDAALPEIEKLVNLSREFSVSIDWLLGQEDEAREPRELTPEQIRVVEEIVGRYLAARPAEKTVILRETVEAEPGDGGAQ